MIWAILALLGVPLRLCALGTRPVVLRNRMPASGHSDIPVRVFGPRAGGWGAVTPGEILEVACRSERRPALVGRFVAVTKYA
jgi:hypothetical protein